MPLCKARFAGRETVLLVHTQEGTQREVQYQQKPALHIPQPESTTSAQKTVILAHTVHDAWQLRPANVGREHSVN